MTPPPPTSPATPPRRGKGRPRKRVLTSEIVVTPPPPTPPATPPRNRGWGKGRGRGRPRKENYLDLTDSQPFLEAIPPKRVEEDLGKINENWSNLFLIMTEEINVILYLVCVVKVLPHKMQYFDWYFIAFNVMMHAVLGFQDLYTIPTNFSSNWSTLTRSYGLSRVGPEIKR